MTEILSYLAHVHPGWTLLAIFVLLYALISAVPETAAAIRGHRKEGKAEEDEAE